MNKLNTRSFLNDKIKENHESFSMEGQKKPAVLKSSENNPFKFQSVYLSSSVVSFLT